MGIKEANLYLDNQYNTYYAGQTINGRIEYVFDNPKKVRGIHVKFKGEAHTEWFESKQEENSQDKTTENTNSLHTGNEEYFQISYYLLGSNTGNEIEIPAGKHVYNFTCTLPPVLPSSFEGEFGYVRYTVKVTLDRPWKFDQETKMAFTVINALDLNLNPSYKEPIHIQMEKTFCCFCCASPPLTVDVRAPVSGYCPGQVIPVQIDIENKSNVQLELVKVFLRKVVTYRATTPSTVTKKSKDIVLTMQQGPAPAGSTKNWVLNMEVPPIPPSNLVNCNIIDLDYDFKGDNLDQKYLMTVLSPKILELNLNDRHLIIGCDSIPYIRLVKSSENLGLNTPVHSSYFYHRSFSVVAVSLWNELPIPIRRSPSLPFFKEQVECVVSGMHLNMHDKKYITIGTVPLVGMAGQAVPSPTSAVLPPSPSQPAVLPVAPGASVQPNVPSAQGDGMPGGWVQPSAPPPEQPFQGLYPTLTQPVYKESVYSARTIQDRGDNNYTNISGPKFAPYYPTYAAVQPPPLPQ